MVIRNYRGDVTSGAFKRIKLPFIINEMVLLKEAYTGSVDLRIYKQKMEGSGGHRSKTSVLFISTEGIYLGYNYRYSVFELDVDRNLSLKVIGIDMT